MRPPISLARLRTRSILLLLLFACGRGRDTHVDAAAGETARRRDCTLLPPNAVAAAVGSSVDAPVDASDDDETHCSYALPGGVSTVELRVQWHAGDAGWQGARAGDQVLARASSSANLPPMVESVPGLGDDAFVQSVELPAMPSLPSLPSIPGVKGGVDLSALASGQAALWVKKGDAVLSVVVANQHHAKEKAVAVARAALPRL